MNGDIQNRGIMITDGSVGAFGQVLLGDKGTINNIQAEPVSPRSASRSRGIGVVSIKANETSAVVDVFGLTRERATPNGQDIHTGTIEGADGRVDLIAARTLEPGQRSIMATLQNLRTHYDPALFVLVGIGGGISSVLDVGDAVIATRVIYYDMRRETADGVHRRGEERHAPAAVTHAVNSFFTDKKGEPAELDSVTGTFRVHTGPIGSGEAVVMDAQSTIRTFLSTYNEKALAVDMESGGLTQFCHEHPPSPSWLVVRGISDLADRAKSYDPQSTAAHNAAVTLHHLIPYLPINTVP